MDRTPAPVSLAAARARRPPEGSRAAEVFRDEHVWIRFAAHPTSGPQAPHRMSRHWVSGMLTRDTPVLSRREGRGSRRPVEPRSGGEALSD